MLCTARTTRGSLVRKYSSAASQKVYIVNGKRTPFGKFGGSLKDATPVDLCVASAKAALADAGVQATDIDHVIFANVLPSTTDTLYGARHIALKVGAKMETPGYAVNRLCGSGIQSIVDAARLIRCGEAQCVLATGSENMSMVPHLTYGTRFGTRYNAFQVKDMLMDALTDSYCGTPMAITAENLAEKYSISREDVDKYSLESHEKASKATKENRFQGEITPIPLKKTTLSADEQVRHGAALSEMSSLPAVFKKNGTVTAATASGIVDGSASLLVCSEAFVKKHGLKPLAEVGDYSVIGVDPTIMGIGPAPAIRGLLEKTGQSLKDIDLFEINEAFAAQTLACIKDLDLDASKLNKWGGAIAIGHPLGASGLRISLTLAHQLKHYGVKQGIASACIGGGQGIALQIHAAE